MTTEMDPDPREEPEDGGAWEVTARWLFDLDSYNEWMNEEDYLAEDNVSFKGKNYFVLCFMGIWNTAP